jgi:hypothetical protein
VSSSERPNFWISSCFFSWVRLIAGAKVSGAAP